MYKITAGVATAGVLTFGLASVAGASATAPAAHRGQNVLTMSDAQLQQRLASFNCDRAERALGRIARIDARISAGLPHLHAAEQKATERGNTARAARIERRINVLTSSTLKDRLATIQTSIENKCHVSAPTGSSVTSTTVS